MISSISSVWKPTSLEPNKKIQGAVEVTNLKLSAGGGAAAVAIYDSNDLTGCNENSLRWFLDASTTDNDFNAFGSPITFTKGVYAVCEQGINFAPIVSISAVKYPA